MDEDGATGGPRPSATDEILDSISDAAFAVDDAWRFTSLNGAAARLLRGDRQELLGQLLWDNVPEPDGGRAAAEERERLEQLRQAATARTLRLVKVAAALTEAMSEASIGRLLLVEAAGALGATGGGVALVGEDGMLHWLTVDGYPDQTIEELRSSPLDVDRPLTRVLATRAPQFLTSPEALRRNFPAVAELFARVGDHALACVPLVASGRCLGAVTVTFSEARQFGPEDRMLLAALADTAAQAVERARLYEREHEVAETLQRALLPDRLAQPPGVVAAARYLPGTDGIAVGGDWYDVFELGDNRLGIALGDVVGKGVTAASVMGRLRNALRAYATSFDSPSVVLSRLDDFVGRFGSDDLATLVYGVLDTSTGELRFCTAGHLPPLHVDADGSPALLPHRADVPVGVIVGERRPEQRLRLPPGSTLVLYSDGLVEDRQRSLDVGFESLLTAARRLETGLDVEYVCDQLIEELVGPTGRDDDIAVLVLRWAPSGPPGELAVALPAEVASARRARSLVTEELRAWDEEELVETASLCVSEVVTNAVLHAGTPVALRVTLLPRHVRVEVGDGGVAPPERVEAPPEAVRGRGVAIVELFSTRWGVETHDDGKTVWFELARTRPEAVPTSAAS